MPTPMHAQFQDKLNMKNQLVAQLRSMHDAAARAGDGPSAVQHSDHFQMQYSQVG